jgi:tocopherol cyclase
MRHEINRNESWYNEFMSSTLRDTPFLFQGSLTKPNYFEGWYYKQVHENSDRSISFIFGISTRDPHAFIQIITSNPLVTTYVRYPLESYQAQENGYRLGKSFFSPDRLILDVEDATIAVKGELLLSQMTPIHRNAYAPNIMGPFAYLGNMECNHGVVSMSHRVNGSITVNGKSWSFADQVGYLEKDWGRSFPRRYVWIQGNHFDQDAALMVSVANIPFMGLRFEGVICQLNIGNEVMRIATYTGARCTGITHTDDGFQLTIKQGSMSLEVIAHVPDQGILKSPSMGAMTQTIKEGLGGTVDVVLHRKGQEPLRLTSTHCGIEIEGY